MAAMKHRIASCTFACILLMPTVLLADGAAIIPVGGAVLTGCPGDVVVFDLLAFYDNCACQPGFQPPPAAGCAVVYTSIISNGPSGFPGVFLTMPTPTNPAIPCTPNPNPGCLPFPATGIAQITFQVGITIPPGTAPGSTDSITVAITICGLPASVPLTVNVIDCDPPPPPACNPGPPFLPDLQAGRNFPAAAVAFGSGRSENIDIGDADNDGDFDVIVANGGDGPNQGNVIYINNGGVQGGTEGTFSNGTAARFPGIPPDRSRDIEFADFDADCDLDIFVANTGSVAEGGQASRAYINQGGQQFGPVGFYQDGTNAFWRTLVAVPAGDQILGGNTGPWRDYSCDCDFGDLDLDGDIDLFHSSYGPNIGGSRDSRIFMNNGEGLFDEFWPWANAGADIQLHTLDIDLVDLDSDFDLDVFASSRNSQARVYRNNLQADGTFPGNAFSDITQSALLTPGAVLYGGNNYEVEFGDVDGDGDFDLYGMNFAAFQDRILRNNGDMTFSSMSWINCDANQDEREADFLDYDNDGDLDVFVANFSGTNRIYASGLAQGLTGSSLYNRTGSGQAPDNETPASSNSGTTLDGQCADMDGDGDTDILLANDSNQQNRYWNNALGVPDTHAPTVHMSTIQGNKADGSDTPLRVQLRDNANSHVMAFYDVDLLYTVNGGIENRIKMVSQGSQQFQATIPGGINGAISYRMAGADGAGNAFSTTPVNYTQSSTGAPAIANIDDGTPGVAGNPYLELNGSFFGGTTVSVQLCDAAPNSLAILFLSLASTPVPFKGGLLHTIPIAAQFSLSTDAAGGRYFEVPWPLGLPSGAKIWYQYGIADGTSSYGATLSNAVVSTQP